jgi:hypothetical protein
MKVLVQTHNKNNARIIGKENFVINDGSAQSQYMAFIVHTCQFINCDLLTKPDFLNYIKKSM